MDWELSTGSYGCAVYMWMTIKHHCLPRVKNQIVLSRSLKLENNKTTAQCQSWSYSRITMLTAHFWDPEQVYVRFVALGITCFIIMVIVHGYLSLSMNLGNLVYIASWNLLYGMDWINSSEPTIDHWPLSSNLDFRSQRSIVKSGFQKGFKSCVRWKLQMMLRATVQTYELVVEKALDMHLLEVEMKMLSK